MDVYCNDCLEPFRVGQLVVISARAAHALGRFRHREHVIVSGAYPDLNELGVLGAGEGLYEAVYRDDRLQDIGWTVDPAEARHIRCSLRRGRRSGSDAKFGDGRED